MWSRRFYAAWIATLDRTSRICASAPVGASAATVRRPSPLRSPESRRDGGTLGFCPTHRAPREILQANVAFCFLAVAECGAEFAGIPRRPPVRGHMGDVPRGKQ